MNENSRRVIEALEVACYNRIKSDFVKGLSSSLDTDGLCLYWAGAHTKDVANLCDGFMGKSGVLRVLNKLENDGVIMADKGGTCYLWWPVGLCDEIKAVK